MNVKITNNNLNNYNDTLYIMKHLGDYNCSIIYYDINQNEFIDEIESELKLKNIKYVRKHINYLNSIEVEESDVIIIDNAEAKSDKSLMFVINYLYGKKKQVIMNYKNKVSSNLSQVLSNKKYIRSGFREEL